MKNILLFLCCCVPLLGHTQTMRYFQFTTTNCGHNNWQDTAFIAAASDTVLINQVLAELNNPTSKFIAGPIAHGNGGYNHNASHWFLWHFIPNQWRLAENSIEVCDGCPYTDVDADTATWIGVLGNFCPWSGIPVREVSAPAGIVPDPAVSIIPYPNPVSNRLFLRGVDVLYPAGTATLTLYNANGQLIMKESFTQAMQAEGLNLSALSSGIYLLQLSGTQSAQSLRYKLVKAD